MAFTPRTSAAEIQVGNMQFLHCALSATTGTITGATAANPVVITDATHGLETGDRIRITGVVGMTELNNRDFVVEKVDADSFKLKGEDGSGHTAYSSDGTWTKYTVTGFGLTMPGSSLTLGRSWREQTADQTGTTPIGKVNTGESCMANVTLKQLTPALLAIARPDGMKTGSSAGSTRVEGGGKLAGTINTRDDGFLLVLHPNGQADEDPTGEWRVYNAYIEDVGAIPFGHDQDQELPLTISGVPDTDRAVGVQTWGYFQ